MFFLNFVFRRFFLGEPNQTEITKKRDHEPNHQLHTGVNRTFGESLPL